MRNIILSIGILLSIFSLGQNNYTNRSVSEVKQAMDSLITEQYDVNLDSWINYSKTQFYFNANSCDTLHKLFNWDIGLSQWVYIGKKSKTFDNNKNITETRMFIWDSNTSLYTNFNKYEFTYDINNNNKTVEIEYNWDETLSLYISVNVDTFSFDINNNYMENIHYIWSEADSELILYSKIENEYNIDNLLIESISFLWDSGLNIWNNNYKSIYQYDVNNNCVQKDGYNWQNNSWEENSKKVYDYNGESKEIASGTYDWSNDSWLITDSINKNYDTFHSLVEYSFEQISNGLVYNSNKEVYSHNESYTYSDLILPSTYTLDSPYNDDWYNNFNNQILTTTVFARQNDSYPWQESSKTSYYYSQRTVDNITKITDNNFILYPNPTTGQIRVKGKNIDQIEIYNSSGTLIKRTHKKFLDLSQEGKGIYFVKLITKEGTKTEKIVLE